MYMYMYTLYKNQNNKIQANFGTLGKNQEKFTENKKIHRKRKLKLIHVCMVVFLKMNKMFQKQCTRT